MTEPSPLILTAVLDAPVQQRLDALRRAHFPPERNHLDAHVTLFHHLPGAEEAAIAEVLAEATRSEPAPSMETTGVRSLGRGVAKRRDRGDAESDLLAHGPSRHPA